MWPLSRVPVHEQVPHPQSIVLGEARSGVERGSRQSQQDALAADAERRVLMIDQFAQFTGVRAAAILFEPLQLHLQAGDLLEQLSFLDLPLVLILALLAAGQQLTGAIQKLPLPLAHLDGMDGVISGDLLDRLAATDRLHGRADSKSVTGVLAGAVSMG